MIERLMGIVRGFCVACALTMHGCCSSHPEDDEAALHLVEIAPRDVLSWGCPLYLKMFLNHTVLAPSV